MPPRPPRRPLCGSLGAATGVADGTTGGVGADIPPPPIRLPRPPLRVTCAASSAASPIIKGFVIFPPGTREPNTLSRNPIVLSLCLMSPSTGCIVIEHQHHDRTNHGNDHAVEIKTGDAAHPDGAEEEAS